MQKRPIRWWPAAGIGILNAGATGWLWLLADTIRQNKVVNTFLIEFLTISLLAVWLLFFSRAKLKIRLFTFGSVLVVVALFFAFFKVHEVSGDLFPSFKWRWAPASHDDGSWQATSTVDLGEIADFSRNGSISTYPQFLGPSRTAVLEGVRLSRDWETTPPKLVWKRPIGEGWSAFSVYGSYAVTQEQSGDRELVVAYQLLSGKVLWQHGDQARYQTVLGGTGPRATPTIAAGRVYTLGATGILNCLELTTGSRVWSTAS
ncbi:MAG: hypothetical protein ACE5IY_10740 [bacterium]